MRVRHLNCGSMRPFGGRLLDGAPGLIRSAELVCHVLLVETDAGLVLVDTGFSRADLANPVRSLPAAFVSLARPVADPALAAVRQVAALGYQPADVRHIVLTHLDLDHAGGLRDFPRAAVHLYGPEYRAAMSAATPLERRRYRPGNWAHRPKWHLYDPEDGEHWFGFDAVRGLIGLPEDEFLLIPLTGHTRGHAGVAVRDGERWLLHAGDAYFHRAELAAVPSCPPLLSAFQSQVQLDGRTRRDNQARLRALAAAHPAEVTVFSAHDAVELRRLAG